jgi:putative ABC transport system permease protein
MIALALRSLGQRKLRTALTAIAVLLGVAMIAGTYVQTDRIRGAFEALTQTANRGTDVVVSPHEAFTSSVGQATKGSTRSCSHAYEPSPASGSPTASSPTAARW